MPAADEKSLPFMYRLLIFAKERFSPLSHGIMISLFVACHYSVAALSRDAVAVSLIDITAILIGTIVFFFKLRVYDEIKDYEVDLKFKPGRPLARGLVSALELKRTIAACIITELVLFGIVSIQGLVSITIAIAYSLLMYKEFFISPLIRPHLTTYAVSHTFVCGILSLGLYATVHGMFPWQESSAAFFFAAASWCLFNIFEFGRKSYATCEENAAIDSYSSIFGRYGAVALVLVMAAVVSLLVPLMNGMKTLSVPVTLWAFTAALGGVGLLYALLNHAFFSKLFRAASSIYIIVVYAGIFIISR